MIRKSTWIILAVFALALTGALLWQRNQQQAALATPEGGAPEYLFDFGDATLSGLRIERVDDRVVELERSQDGVWTAKWPQQPQPVDSQTLEATAGSLAAMTSLARLEDAAALEDYGLTPPVYRLLLTLSDGRQLLAAVGKSTPTQSGYYVQVGNRGVFVVSAYTLDPVLGLVDAVPLLEPVETPAVTPALDDAATAPAPATP